MAGLTAEGLVIKRYSEILEEKRERAITRFLDLIEPGDQVDVSDSSTLGRLISLSIPGEADLWEAVQEVYDAFNPNAATGVSLDNLVALAGIERFGETHSTVQGVFAGSTSTMIPPGSVVNSRTTGEDWEVVGGGVFLDPSRAQGVTVVVTTVTPNVDYSVSFSTEANTYTATYTASATPTATEILSGLQSYIQSNFPTLFSDLVGETLNILNTVTFQEGEWEISSRLGITRVAKVGTLRAVNPGPITQEPGTVTNIRTPVLGWESVSNPAAAVPGRWLESDEELRIRFRNSKYQRAGNILEALYTALTNIPEVREAKIYENDTDVTDENGVPPHSFLPVVLGGDENVIADTIWNNKPLGIRSYGNTVVTIIDSQFFPHDIGFERPAPVPIYITIELTTDAEFPSDGVQRIKDSLIEYFSNFRIGDDVVYSRLYTPVNKVKGHQVDAMYIGTSHSPSGSSNIVIPFNQIASISSANIEVNTTGG